MACNSYNVLRRGLNQKIISISIGDNEKIDSNQIKELMKIVKDRFPGWIIRIYHSDNLDLNTICELECLQNEIDQMYYDNIDFCSVHDLNFENVNITNLNSTYWKFVAIGDNFSKYILIRDKLSCFSEQEASAIQEWIKTDYLFHTFKGIFLF